MSAIDSRVISPSCEYCRNFETKESKVKRLFQLIWRKSEEAALTHVHCVEEVNHYMKPFHGTPLRSAVSFKMVQLVRVLLGAGADVEVTSKYDDSLFSDVVSEYACGSDRDWKNGKEIFDLLWNSGLRTINAQGFHNQTPLEAAILHSNKKAVELLLKKGADPSLGHSLRTAARIGNLEMANLLLSSPKGLSAYEELLEESKRIKDQKVCVFLDKIKPVFIKSAAD